MAIKHLLLKVNVPEDEIEEVLKVFKEGKVRDMFQMIEEYDVQKVRSEEKAKAKKEMAQKMLRKGIGVPDIIDITGLDKEKIEEIKKEIEQ